MPFRLESQAEPIPGYKLIERLGSGGFGEVWKAEAPGGLLKAIKFVYGDVQTAEGDDVRAEQELKSLSRIKTLRHPYILSLERFDIIDGQLVIVMELADRNLWDRFRECRSQGLAGIPREELLRYMEETAEALDLMNNQYQLQHLDIKPQNLFLIYNHVKVADFGLVKDLEGKLTSVTGGVTPVYAAPEMFDGWVSRFCDQYSLAIVYQELLTGQRPFAATNVHQLIMQHVKGKPNLGGLSAQDQGIIARALAKNPEERHASCADLVHALRTLGREEAAGPHVENALRTGATTSAPAGLALEEPYPPTLLNRDAGLPQDTPSPGRSGRSTPPPQPAQTPTAAPELPSAAELEKRQAAVTEIDGDGELFPAVVIGLGQQGLNVLLQLHDMLQEKFGPREALPHVRLLYLDTDPEAVQEATRGRRRAALPGREVLLVRLNRASHYLKPREGRPRIDTWFDPNMLYRIQRHQITGGLRALGRLAFLDHYRVIAQRLRADLEACTDPAAVAASARQTGLKLRTNRPRIYVITSLAGGTGSGMFIDLAYVVRDLVKQLGFARPEVVGCFFLPQVVPSPAQTVALGNTYAALTELHHFSCQDVTFSARYDAQEAPLADPEPPFNRCVLLPLPNGPKEAPRDASNNLLSQFLVRDLLTPLGRICDAARAGRAGAVAPRRAPEAAPAACLGLSSFGMFRYYWPRKAVLARGARQFCQLLVKRWATKDTGPLRETIQAMVQEQWAQKELAADFMIARLQAACEKALGQAPETALAALTDPFAPKSRWRAPQLDPDAVALAIDKIEHMVGQPSPSAVLQRPGALEQTLQKEADGLVAQWADKLAKITVPLIEQPGFRLAGAEETIRQVIGLIEQVLEHHEPLCQELSDKAGKANDRLQFLRPNIREIVTGGRRTAAAVSELVEILRLYPKWRYQSLVLKRVNLAYTSLRGYLSDQIREVGFCRVRLSELLADLEKPVAEEPVMAGSIGQSCLFPAGCLNVNDVGERLIADVTPAEIDELDRHMQGMIRTQFGSLAHVCTTSSNLLKNLKGAMLAEAENFGKNRLPGDDVVDMYLARYHSSNEALDDLADAFDGAAPTVADANSSGRAEICILSAPASPKRDQLTLMARQAITSASLVDAASADDIVVYRENPQLCLAELEQMGQCSKEAYQQMSTMEHLTPHCRTDITDWHNPSSGCPVPSLRSNSANPNDEIEF